METGDHNQKQCRKKKDQERQEHDESGDKRTTNQPRKGVMKIKKIKLRRRLFKIGHARKQKDRERQEYDESGDKKTTNQPRKDVMKIKKIKLRRRLFKIGHARSTHRGFERLFRRQDDYVDLGTIVVATTYGDCLGTGFLMMADTKVTVTSNDDVVTHCRYETKLRRLGKMVVGCSGRRSLIMKILSAFRRSVALEDLSLRDAAIKLSVIQEECTLVSRGGARASFILCGKLHKFAELFVIREEEGRFVVLEHEDRYCIGCGAPFARQKFTRKSIPC